MASTKTGLALEAEQEIKAIRDSDRTAELGNTLSIRKDLLRVNAVDVKWQKWGSERVDKYYHLAFTNTTLSNVKGNLFIHASYIANFEGITTTDGDRLTFTLTNAFQYGQKDKSGRNRFLVFHSPELKEIYQHRFIQASLVKYGTLLGGLLSDNVDGAKKGTEAVMDLAKSMFGDTLRVF
ncbi:hypothetical protein K461DRAFT_319062 [Myriangium duriaei CBS 260.36]|uniref:Uncharacterized protein n=1 Tax=Myriangium duriaei CBS 260.36 TaxID=1168546 RepID=A0A9P4J485_9PEZI|nr:hypothetical protein K461DRAFT_319062 [Myriangium duriaei CBS 260.36]